MTGTALSVSQVARRNPLAACIASLFALSAPAAMAGANLPVTSCDDSGPDTLREVISNAASGDTVDLSGLLACASSRISLTSGEIPVKQDDLTIKGPGAANLAIDGSGMPSGPGDYRLFNHSGAGTLTLRDVRLTEGHVYHDSSTAALGGCVYSAANLELYDTEVVSCSATSTDGAASGGGLLAYGTVKLHSSTMYKNEAASKNSYAQGGAIWAKGDALLDHSRVEASTADTAGTFAYAGGIFANGSLTLSYSTLSSNVATSTGKGATGGGAQALGAFVCEYSTIDGNSALGSYASTYAGGVFARADASLKRCTVSRNHSDGAVGGFGASSGAMNANTNTLDIRSSTVSGNSSGFLVGGLFSDAATTRLYNTTVAFNTAFAGHVGAPTYYFAPGVALSAQPNALVVTLQSSLISNNTYGSTEVDLSAATTLLHPITFNVGPANNFVRTYLASNLPSDTLTKSCPLLGPLRDNGGPTQTHALLSTSVAIDAGNNVLGDDQDQRGLMTDTKPFPYPRQSTVLADIGAYEVNQDDIAFNSGFEGCDDL